MAVFNNFKKISLLLVAVILYCGFAGADLPDSASDMGVITLIIKNRPPVITNIHLSPNTAFEGTALECVPAVNDERTDEVKLIYKWHINDKLIETNANHLAGFKGNDLVNCEVTPIDNEGVFGEAKSMTIAINKKPVLHAITSFVIKNYN